MDDFRNLEVWQRAMERQRECHAVARRSPAAARYELGSQLRRASSAVVTNLVEGDGQTTRANFRRHLGIARASAREVHSHLLSAIDLGSVAIGDTSEAESLADRGGRMLTKLHDRRGD